MKVLIDRTGIGYSIPRKEWISLSKQADLAQLIETMAADYDPSLSKELTENGELAKGVLVLINGLSVYQMDGIKTKLKDGDNVFFTVMACGG